jgi:hypothetical protein
MLLPRSSSERATRLLNTERARRSRVFTRTGVAVTDVAATTIRWCVIPGSRATRGSTPWGGVEAVRAALDQHMRAVDDRLV